MQGWIVLSLALSNLAAAGWQPTSPSLAKHRESKHLQERQCLAHGYQCGMDGQPGCCSDTCCQTDAGIMACVCAAPAPPPPPPSGGDDGDDDGTSGSYGDGTTCDDDDGDDNDPGDDDDPGDGDDPGSPGGSPPPGGGPPGSPPSGGSPPGGSPPGGSPPSGPPVVGPSPGTPDPTCDTGSDQQGGTGAGSWGIKYLAGGCNSQTAPYGAYNNTPYSCYNLKQEMNWDAIILTRNGGMQIQLFANPDCDPCGGCNVYNSVYRGDNDMPHSCVTSVGSRKGDYFAQSFQVVDGGSAPGNCDAF